MMLHSTVSYHYLRRTARANAARLNHRAIERDEKMRFRAMHSGRKLFRWKVVEEVEIPKVVGE